MAQNFYSEEEASQILGLAARRSLSGSMSHEELVRAAAEVGVSEDHVLAAEAEYRATQGREQLVQRFWARQKGVLVKELFGLLSTNGTCIGIWWLTGHGYFWPGWVVFGTVVGFVEKIPKRLIRSSLPYQRSFEKWVEKGAETGEVAEREEPPRQVTVGVHVGGRPTTRFED